MKLLQKTIKNYLLYSVFILLIAIPIFYYVIQNILRAEIDEELLATKYSLKNKLSTALYQQNFDKIEILDSQMSLSKSQNLSPYDSISTENIFDVIDKEFIPYRVIHSNFEVNGQYFLITRKISLLENDDLLKSILTVQISMLILLLVGMILINSNLSKRLWKPFYITIDELQKFKVESSESLQLPTSSIDEFSDLNTSLRLLTNRTQQSYIIQKEFAENASHEMQTPLAIFQSKLELLMQTLPLNEAQAKLIDELASATQRMKRLNKSLVLLTKIDNNQFLFTEEVVLNKKVKQFIEQFQPQIDEKSIIIKLEEESTVLLSANITLIEILISNLIGNAIRHNYQNGSISVKIEPNTLIIFNSGNMAELNKNHLFFRFHKQSTDENSIGLGLEIVKKIVLLYGYKIEYSFNNNLHQFAISFRH